MFAGQFEDFSDCRETGEILIRGGKGGCDSCTRFQPQFIAGLPVADQEQGGAVGAGGGIARCVQVPDLFNGRKPLERYLIETLFAFRFKDGWESGEGIHGRHFRQQFIFGEDGQAVCIANRFEESLQEARGRSFPRFLVGMQRVFIQVFPGESRQGGRQVGSNSAGQVVAAEVEIREIDGELGCEFAVTLHSAGQGHLRPPGADFRCSQQDGFQA